MHDLAIIIPAYKPDFFEAALASLANQTGKRFCLYIGDDASPFDLKQIAAKFEGQMEMVYHRFPENCGTVSLVQQWTRCIQLSQEPWVWLFADDDVADPTCVADFYRTRADAHARCELFRFELAYIDPDGGVTQLPPSLPVICGPFEFLYHRMVNNAGSVVPEHIFARRMFGQVGGMVEFPAATCSDDATWLLFMRDEPMGVIPGGKVRWRQSDVHISGRTQARGERAHACIEYIKWLLRETAPDGRLAPLNSYEHHLWREVLRVLPAWLNTRIAYLGISEMPGYDRNEWTSKIKAELGSLAEEVMASFPLSLQEKAEAKRKEWKSQSKLTHLLYWAYQATKPAGR
jgi:hypothetical protein